MNVLVTGGAGFIGSHLVEELVKRGNKVTVLDDLSFGLEENLEAVEDKITFIYGTINNIMWHLKLKNPKFDIIYHLAARKFVPQSFKEPKSFFETNINGTWNIINEFPDARFVNISSSGAEFCQSPYAISKKAGEDVTNLFPNTINIRLYNVFGERQPYGGAIVPSFCNAIMEAGRCVIYGDGTFYRDFTYVGDVVDELIMWGESKHKHKLVKLGYGEPHSVVELFNRIAKQLNHLEEPVYKGNREGDVEGIVAEDIINKPIYGFDKGLEKTVEWYRVQE